MDAAPKTRIIHHHMWETIVFGVITIALTQVVLTRVVDQKPVAQTSQAIVIPVPAQVSPDTELRHAELAADALSHVAPLRDLEPQLAPVPVVKPTPKAIAAVRSPAKPQSVARLAPLAPLPETIIVASQPAAPLLPQTLPQTVARADAIVPPADIPLAQGYGPHDFRPKAKRFPMVAAISDEMANVGRGIAAYVPWF